jgi:hypothetical protein
LNSVATGGTAANGTAAFQWTNEIRFQRRLAHVPARRRRTRRSPTHQPSSGTKSLHRQTSTRVRTMPHVGASWRTTGDTRTTGSGAAHQVRGAIRRRSQTTTTGGRRAQNDRPHRRPVGQERNREELASGLELRSAAARADQSLGRRPLDVDPEGLEVRLHPAMGSNAVHSRRLRVEAAHRDLAAECAGAGHAWSSVVGGQEEQPRKGPNGAVE